MDDSDACYLPDGTAITVPGDMPWQPRTFCTECELLDRLGQKRRYGFNIFAASWEQAEKIARIRGLGEKVVGEIMSPDDIIPV